MAGHWKTGLLAGVLSWQLGAAGVQASQPPLQVAVAANFKPVLTQLVQLYRERTGETIRISSGSTGKLYRQILQGAPYDLFFAADALRPRRLFEQGRADRPQTYAIGALALYQRRGTQPPLSRLKAGAFRHLAIANPRTAPYGRAAMETLERLGLWGTVQPHLVRGENVSQAFQFVETGNAELGFVAWSQVVQAGRTDAAFVWQVPSTYHAPLTQQAVVIRNRPAEMRARAFLTFVTTDPEARRLIERAGYGPPPLETRPAHAVAR